MCKTLSLVLPVAALLLGACVVAPSSSGPVMPTDGGTTACKQGDTKLCACLGGSTSGQKTCNGSGTYGDCAPCTMGAVNPTTTTPSPTGNTTGSSASKCGDCKGCCDGSTCVPFANETDSNCGIKGKSCMACPGTASSCDKSSGKCSAPNTGTSGPCGMSCTGCCSPTDGCISFDSTDSFACGVKGAACKACPIQGGLCTDDTGMCTNQVAYYDTYEISVRQIDAHTLDCSAAAGGELNPDPYVCMYAWDATAMKILTDDDGNPVSGCTSYCPSMGLCNLSVADGIIRGDFGPVQFPGTAITGGQIIVQVYDHDTGIGSAPDLLGTGSLAAFTTLNPMQQMMGGPFTTGNLFTNFDCTVPIQFQVAWDFADQ